MKTSKLWEHYCGLSSSEIKQVKLFLESPFFNKDQKVRELFSLLHKYEARIEQEKADIGFIYKKLFPKDKKQVDWKIREKMSDLVKLLQQYFCTKVQIDDAEQQTELLDIAYRTRKMDRLYFKSIDKQLKELEKQPIRDETYHFMALQLNKKLFDHPNTSKFSGKRIYDLMVNIHYSLDQYYILSKLREYTETIVREYVLGETYTLNFVEEILAFLSQPENKENLHPQVYIELFRLLKTDQLDLKSFHKIKQKVLSYLDTLSPRNQSSQINFLIVIARLSFKPEIQAIEIHNLQWIGVERGIYIEDGYFAITKFNNIVDSGCTLKKFDKTRKFIEKHVKYLSNDDSIRANISRLYYAYLAVGEKNYDEAIHLLEKLEIEDYSFFIRKQILYIKCLYEKFGRDGIELITKQSEKYKIFLHRKHKSKFISKLDVESNMGFIRFVKKLCNYQFQSYSKESLQKEINDSVNLYGKSWLVEKAAELK